MQAEAERALAQLLRPGMNITPISSVDPPSHSWNDSPHYITSLNITLRSPMTTSGGTSVMVLRRPHSVPLVLSHVASGNASDELIEVLEAALVNGTITDSPSSSAAAATYPIIDHLRTVRSSTSKGIGDSGDSGGTVLPRSLYPLFVPRATDAMTIPDVSIRDMEETLPLVRSSLDGMVAWWGAGQQPRLPPYACSCMFTLHTLGGWCAGSCSAATCRRRR